MITFYAAIGSFEDKSRESGTRRPVLIKAGQKYDVSLPEFVLWSSLLWNIYNHDEIKAIYEQKIAETQIKIVPAFDEILELLKRRGLIASGTGYTGIEALYEMLSGLFLVRVHTPLIEKIRSFLYLAFIRHIPFRITSRLFWKLKLDPREQKVWDIISQRTVSTAELIRCMEMNVTDVSTGPKLVEAIYNLDDGVDYKNVVVHSRFSDKRNMVIDVVANLYLKKHVLFET